MPGNTLRAKFLFPNARGNMKETPGDESQTSLSRESERRRKRKKKKTERTSTFSSRVYALVASVAEGVKYVIWEL